MSATGDVAGKPRKWWRFGWLWRFISPPAEIDAQSVIRQEKQAIESAINKTRPWLFGLALSGGGIRSASFAMGVMQSLEQWGVIGRLHYLSTVSGGGYAGASYTWFRSRGVAFPFGTVGQGSRSAANDTGTKILSFIRLNGNYLFPKREYGLLSAVGMVSWSVLWSLLIYSILIFAVVLLLYGVAPFAVASFNDFVFTHLETWLSYSLMSHVPYSWRGDPYPWRPTAFLELASLLTGALSLFMGAFAFATIATWAKAYPVRRFFQCTAGYFVAFIATLLLLAAIPYVDTLLEDWTDTFFGDLLTPTVSVLGTLTGIAAAASRLSKQIEGGAGGILNLRGVLIVASTILLIFSLLLGAYYLAHLCFAGVDESVVWTRFGLLVLAFYGLGSTADLNRISFHGLYRDRLMEVFMPNEAAYETQSWRPAKKADKAKLSTMCPGPQSRDVSAGAPYHLINTNIVLSGSAKKEYRGRGGDSFLLSPLFCGSDATGYQKTKEFLDDHMTLASAMAISGAAINPYSGGSGQGITRNSFVALLLSLLNIRLGYWIRRPETASTRPILSWLKDTLLAVFLRKSPHPDFVNPGLISMIRGGGSEDDMYVELSDGGHFDNTGLYELIRRELDVIVISDASADPDFTFADLGNAIERIRVDFGASIRFCVLDLTGLIPGSGADPILRQKFNIAERGVAVASITYGSGKRGIIIYIKPSIVTDLPADVFAYRAAHPEFPHEPTANQFFDEGQLESYRELGYQLSEKARATLKKLVTSPTPGTLTRGQKDAIIMLYGFPP